MSRTSQALTRFRKDAGAVHLSRRILADVMHSRAIEIGMELCRVHSMAPAKVFI